MKNFLQALLSPPTTIQTISGKLGVVGRVCYILDLVYTAAIIFSVIFILLAAFKYLTSGGNEEKTKEATKALRFIVVGIAVALLARGLPLVIGDFLGGSGTTGKLDTEAACN